jgi:hypothetical protein
MKNDIFKQLHLPELKSLYRRYIWLIILSLFIGLGVPLGVYFIAFHHGFSTNSNDWGNFGLYLSGISGPFFSFASFVGLILALTNSIQEKKDDNAQVLFFRYVDAVMKQNEQNAHDAQQLKQYYDTYCYQSITEATTMKHPTVHEIHEMQTKNIKFFLLIYAIITYIKQTPKLDNETYISILFSYLTYDEKFVFAVDMRKGRSGHTIPQKLQQLIISNFMDDEEFNRRFEKIRWHI